MNQAKMIPQSAGQELRSFDAAAPHTGQRRVSSPQQDREPSLAQHFGPPPMGKPEESARASSPTGAVDTSLVCPRRFMNEGDLTFGPSASLVTDLDDTPRIPLTPVKMQSTPDDCLKPSPGSVDQLSLQSNVSSPRSFEKRNKKGGRRPSKKAQRLTRHIRTHPLSIFCAEIVDHPAFQVFSAVCLILALFLSDIWQLCSVSNEHDEWLYATLTFVMAVFIIEIVLNIIAKKTYLGSFFFWMDVLGTLSMLADIRWFSEPLYGAIGFDPSEGSTLRASRAARVGSRAGRLTRVARLVRLVRVFRAVKLLSPRPDPDPEDDPEDAPRRPSSIGSHLSDHIGKAIAMCIMICVVALPNLGTVMEDTSMTVFVSQFSDMAIGRLRSGGALDECLDELVPSSVDTFFEFYGRGPQGTHVLDLRYFNQTYSTGRAEPRRGTDVTTVKYRVAAEYEAVVDDPHVVVARFDRGALRREEAVFNVIVIVFVLVMLLSFSTNINFAVTSNVVRPLERIMHSLDPRALSEIAPTKKSRTGEPNITKAMEEVVARMVAIVGSVGNGIHQQHGKHQLEAMGKEGMGAEKDFYAAQYSNAAGNALPDRRVKLTRASSLNSKSRPRSKLVGNSFRDTNGNESGAGANGRARLSSAAPASGGGRAPSEAGSPGRPISPLSTASEPDSTPAATTSLPGPPGTVPPGDPSAPVADAAATDGHSTSPIAWLEADYKLVDRDLLNSWDLDTTKLSSKETHAYLLAILDELGVLEDVPLEPKTFVAFTQAVEQLYQQNPYHNWAHACDVTHTIFRFLTLAEDMSMHMDQLEKFALIVAAICHDTQHPGVNNAFLINKKDALAMTYNDVSVLENRHAALMFAVLNDESCNIFQHLKEEEWIACRKIIIKCILATDMSHHFEMVGKVGMFIDMKGENVGAELEHYSDNDRLFVYSLWLHAADISHVAKPWERHLNWSLAVVEEFYNQGDQEKLLGLAVSPMCERGSTLLSKSQIGFIEFVCAPLFKHLVTLCPQLSEVMQMLVINRRMWVDIMAGDVGKQAPLASEDDLEKAQDRTEIFENTNLPGEEEQVQMEAMYDKLQADLMARGQQQQPRRSHVSVAGSLTEGPKPRQSGPRQSKLRPTNFVLFGDTTETTDKDDKAAGVRDSDADSDSEEAVVDIPEDGTFLTDYVNRASAIEKSDGSHS